MREGGEVREEEERGILVQFFFLKKASKGYDEVAYFKPFNEL
jgi:hypothetical protein